MCGLAGYSVGPKGLASRDREDLVYALGLGIDDRGGHAAGHVTLTGHAKPQIGRKLGYWQSARDGFIRRASSGHAAILHARFATCGHRTIDEVHPFTVERGGRAVLWGAHNGIIDNARESAKRHDRPYDVDSRELLELLADGDLAAIQALNGYGVIAWCEAATPGAVFVARLSASSDLYVAETTCGSIVWGSTYSIVHDACDMIGIEIKHSRTCDEIGRVYRIQDGEVYWTERSGVHVAARAPALAYGFRRWESMWSEEDDEEAKRIELGMWTDDSSGDVTSDDVADEPSETEEEDDAGDPFAVDDTFATEWAAKQWENERASARREWEEDVRRWKDAIGERYDAE